MNLLFFSELINKYCLNFSVLILNMEDIDRYNPYEQNLFEVCGRLHSGSLKLFISESPEPVNVILYGKLGSTDVVKDLEMGDYPG